MYKKTYKIELWRREANETYYSDPAEHFHNDFNYDGGGDWLEKSFSTPKEAFDYIRSVRPGYFDWNCSWNETAKKNDLSYYIITIIEFIDGEHYQDCYTNILGVEELDIIENELVKEWNDLNNADLPVKSYVFETWEHYISNTEYSNGVDVERAGIKPEYNRKLFTSETLKELLEEIENNKDCYFTRHFKQDVGYDVKYFTARIIEKNAMESSVITIVLGEQDLLVK